MIDLVYEWIEVFEEVMDLEFPCLQAWMEDFNAVTVIRDHIPNHHQMVLHLRRCRQQQLLQSALN